PLDHNARDVCDLAHRDAHCATAGGGPSSDKLVNVAFAERRERYARAGVIVRHLLDGGYRVYLGNQLTARAKGSPPTSPMNEGARTPEQKEEQQRRRNLRPKLKMEEATDSLTRGALCIFLLDENPSHLHSLTAAPSGQAFSCAQGGAAAS